MTTKDILILNEEQILNTYERLKDEDDFKALSKMMKKYKLALESGVGHVTIEKVLKSNSIIL